MQLVKTNLYALTLHRISNFLSTLNDEAQLITHYVLDELSIIKRIMYHLWVVDALQVHVHNLHYFAVYQIQFMAQIRLCGLFTVHSATSHQGL